MNLRNKQIFGWRGFGKPTIPFKKIHVLSMLVIVLLGAVIWLWLGYDGTSSGSTLQPSITGAAVIQQQPTIEEETIAETEEVIIKEETEEEEGLEEREFYEYKGECARDMKTRQDDIDDINSQLVDYNARLEELQNEYDKKVQELREEYQIPRDNAQAKRDKAERQLVSVEETWKERKEYCDRKYPR